MKPGRFTLVELLMVLAIIILLICLLLPSLGKAKEAAKMISCKNNLKQISTQLFVYSTEWNGWGPYIYWGTGQAYHTYSVRGYLFPYDSTKDVKTLICPSAQGALGNPTCPYRAGRVFSSVWTFSAYCIAFGIGDGEAVLPLGGFFGWTTYGTSTPDSALKVKCPKLTMLGTTVVIPYTTQYVESPSRQVMAGDISSTTDIITGYGISCPRSHKDGSNNVFMDGHTASARRNQYFHYIKFYDGNCKLYWE